MTATLKFIPGTTIRWGTRRFVVVDYAGMDAIIADSAAFPEWPLSSLGCQMKSRRMANKT
jgi:hypothetical protein